MTKILNRDRYVPASWGPTELTPWCNHYHEDYRTYSPYNIRSGVFDPTFDRVDEAVWGQVWSEGRSDERLADHIYT